jgi:alcohol-forming fatty acyl-CoA reductase
LGTLIEGYANTYCYTKTLFERSMNKKVGNMPACIVRPSMVGPSVSEPYEGWIDTLAAVGGPIFFGGLGVFNY